MRSNSVIKRLVTGWLVFWLSFQPLLAAAEVISDPNAGSHRPIVDATENGTPLVHITTPSAGGVSRNEYSDFSTSANGLFLNNHSEANSVVSSSRGDIIGTNPNLVGSGSATVILNEVTSTRRSDLNGDIEVLGSQAEVVIANPNGITCNGCGFINTSRGVLTTGRPIFGGTGSLEAFRVTGGDITVGPDGLNAADAAQLALISRLLDVQGPIWAQDLNVVVGSNHVGYADLDVTQLAGTGTAPTVGIDVAALGGMYANKIHLISNEAGVGVNNRGEIGASLSDVTIDASGQLLFSGKLSAKNDVRVTGTSSLQNSGTVYAQQDVDINADGNVSNSGTLQAGEDLALRGTDIANAGGGTIVAVSGNVNVQAQQTISNAGKIGSAQAQVLVQANGSITQSGTIASGTDSLLNAGTNITNTGVISAAGHVVANAAGNVSNTNEISATGDISVTGAAISNTQSLVSTQGDVRLAATSMGLTNQGIIETQARSGDISLTAHGDVVQSGDISAAGDLDIVTTGGFLNDGDIFSQGALGIVATGNAGNSGFILGKNGASISASTFVNHFDAALVSTAGSVDVSTRGDIYNHGTLYALKDIVLRALPAGTQVATVRNYGQIEAGRSVALGFDCVIDPATGNCTTTTLSMQKNVNVQNHGSVKSKNNIYVHAKNFDNNLSYSIGDSGDYIITSMTAGFVRDGAWHGHEEWRSVQPHSQYFVYKSTTPLMLAGALLEIRTNKGSNVGGALAGNNVSLAGFGANSTFTNSSVVTRNWDSRTDYDYNYSCADYDVACVYPADHRTFTGSVVTAGPVNENFVVTESVGGTIKGVSVNFSGFAVENRGAGAEIRGSADSVVVVPTVPVNAPTVGTVLPGVSALPTGTNGLFVENTSPDRQFLYVSNPKYKRDAEDALSTDFLLEQLNNDGSDLLRLGDALYEQQLVLEQILNQTGGAFIGEFTVLEDQFASLMSAGAEIAERFGLVLGQKLTPEQIAALDKDIVWLEYIEVNGVLALAPKVYFSQATKANSTGGQILAKNLVMDVASFTNQGGDVVASDSAVIIAEGDIRNTDGSIYAGNLAIASTDGRIINETTIRREGDANNYRDIVDRQASISSDNSLLLSGAEGVDILGANVSAGGDMTIHSSSGDIRVESLALESRETDEEYYYGVFSSGYERTVTTTQTALTSGLSSGGNMSLVAENGFVALVSAMLDSLGNIGMQARDVNSQALALSSSTAYESASSGIGMSGGSLFIGSSSSTRSEYVTAASGSSVTAGGLLSVNASNDINLEGGNYSAQAGAFSAGNNFTTAAAQNRSTTSSASSSAGLSIGNGSIGLSASAASSNTDGTHYENANLTFDNSLAINAGKTADIGGMNAIVVNRAQAPAASESSDAGENASSAVVDDAVIAPPVPDGMDIEALRLAAASGDASDYIRNATENGLGFAEFFSAVDPTAVTGALSIAANDITSTKFQDSYSESSASSGFSIGVQTHSEQNENGANAGVSLSAQSHSSQEAYDLAQDNINVLSGDAVSLVGANSIDLKGVDISGESLVSLQSDGDINIAAAEFSESFSSSSQVTGVSLGAGANANLEHSLEDSAGVSASVSLSAGHDSSSESGSLRGHADSVLSSGGTLQIVSAGDTNWTGVTAAADTLLIKAENFNSAAYEDSSSYNQSTNSLGLNLTVSTDVREMASDLLSGNGSRHTTLKSSGTEQVGNTLIANTAIIDVSDNVTLVGGNYFANDLIVRADTVDIVAAKSTSEQHSTEAGVSFTMDGSAAIGGSKAWASIDSMSGEMDAGTSHSLDHADRTNEGRVNSGKAISDELLAGKTGLSISYHEETSSSTSYSNANIGFTNLDINTTGRSSTDGHVDIGGANLVAFDDAKDSSINITTGELKTTKYVDSSETTVHDNSTFIGIATEAHSAVADTYNHENTLNEKVAEGMTTDEGWVAGQRAADASNILMGDLVGASASATIRNTDTRSHSASTSENINYLSAANINITTTRGDIEFNGVEFNAPPVYSDATGKMEPTTRTRANSVTLDSAGDIRVAAAKSTHEETSITLYNDLSLTAAGSVGGSGAGVGVEAGYNGNIEQSSLKSTSYSNASISGDNVTLKAQNLSLTGANIDGGAVNIDVEHNIDITSVQDTQTQSTSRANWGGSAGLNTMTVVSLNGQGGSGESHDNFALTSQQSGIHAESALNVDAGGNLTLTGAHLALDQGGSGRIQVGGDLVANQLNDFHDKDGLFAGGGFGVDESGLNGNVNIEKVDTIAQKTTQNSSISGVTTVVDGQVRGDNLNADGTLHTEQQTVLQDEHVAGVFINGTGSTAAMRRGVDAASTLVSSASQQAGQTADRAAAAIAQFHSSGDGSTTRLTSLAETAPTPLYRPLGESDGQQTSGHWIGGEPVINGRTPTQQTYITGTTMNIQHGKEVTLAQRADALKAWSATERQIALDARQNLTNPKSEIFQQSSHMVHEQRGDIKRALDAPDSSMNATNNLALVTGQKRQDGKREYDELMDMMAQGKEGPLTKEQSALGVQAAAAGHQVMRDVRQKLPRVDANRKGDGKKATHPTTTATGVDLSKDLGTLARDQTGLMVMTGTSGTSSDVVNSHLSATRHNAGESDGQKRFAAEGLTDQQAKTAVKDMTMAWMRTGEFSDTMKGKIESTLTRDGKKLIADRTVDETTVQSHSYSEISTAVDLTLSGKTDDASVRRSVADAKNRLEEAKAQQPAAKATRRIKALMKMVWPSRQNDSQYDNNVIVVMGDAGGKVDKTVMDSAHDLKQKNPPNTYIVYANADGSGFRGDDLKKISGNVRVNIVGHGSNVRQKDAGDIAGLVDTISKVMNSEGERAEVRRVGLVACGTCLDQGDASYGKALAEALYDRGLTPDVAERTHTLQVNEDGSKTSFTSGKQDPKKIVYRAHDGEVTRESQDARHVSDVSKGSRLLNSDDEGSDDESFSSAVATKRAKLNRKASEGVTYPKETSGKGGYTRTTKNFIDPPSTIEVLKKNLGEDSALYQGRIGFARREMGKDVTLGMIADAKANPLSRTQEAEFMVRTYGAADKKSDIKLQEHGIERDHINANGQVATQITDYASRYIKAAPADRAKLLAYMKTYAAAHGLDSPDAENFSRLFQDFAEQLAAFEARSAKASTDTARKAIVVDETRAVTAMLDKLVPMVADQPGNLRFGRSQHARHSEVPAQPADATGPGILNVSNQDQGSHWDGNYSQLNRQDTPRSQALKEMILMGKDHGFGDEDIATSSTTRPVDKGTTLPMGSNVIPPPAIPSAAPASGLTTQQ